MSFLCCNEIGVRLLSLSFSNTNPVDKSVVLFR